MHILQIAIIIFLFMETGNIVILYFQPGSKNANGIGVFNAYQETMKDEKTANFVKYLINWIAGAKLIFVMIGIIIVIFGNEVMHQYTVGAFIISILSFYYRLYPLIKKMDHAGEIDPKGYYKKLNSMIVIFILIFLSALVISFL